MAMASWLKSNNVIRCKVFLQKEKQIYKDNVNEEQPHENQTGNRLSSLGFLEEEKESRNDWF